MESSIDRIRKLIEIRRYVEAKRLLRDAIEQDPKNADLFFSRAEIAYYEEEIEIGLEATQQGLSVSPLNVGLKYIRFQLLLIQNSFADAEPVIIDLLRTSPDDAEYLSAYARLMMLTFHFDKSRQLAELAIRREPDNLNAKYVLHMVAVISDSSDDARRTLRELILEDPENERSLALMVDLLVSEKRFTEAQGLIQELVRLDPSDTDYIEAAVDIRTFTHWSSIPCWPVIRFGWVGSVAIWIVAILSINFMERPENESPYLGAFVYGYLIWVVYTWVQPLILKKWLDARGI